MINVGAEGLFCLKFFTFHFRFTLKVLKVYEKEKILVVRCELDPEPEPMLTSVDAFDTNQTSKIMSILDYVGHSCFFSQSAPIVICLPSILSACCKAFLYWLSMHLHS